MEIIIIGLIIAYVIVPIFKKVEKNTKAHEKQKQKPFMDFPSLEEAIKEIKETWEVPTVVPQSAPKNQTTPAKLSGKKEIPKSTSKYQPLDIPDVPEGGRLMVSRLSTNSDDKFQSPAVEHLFGKSKTEKRQQLRRAIMLKEILDRKF